MQTGKNKVTKRVKDIIDYTTFMIDVFAEENKLSMKDAHNYLRTYGGLDFLRKHYDIEHCENPEYTLQALKNICSQNSKKVVV
jgi:hypothetical protein